VSDIPSGMNDWKVLETGNYGTLAFSTLQGHNKVMVGVWKDGVSFTSALLLKPSYLRKMLSMLEPEPEELPDPGRRIKP